MLEITRCVATDLALLQQREAHPGHVIHNSERFSLQESGRADFLIAWLDGSYVGRLVLLRESKYAEVCDLLPELREVSGLHSHLEGQGIGTALMREAESVATRDGVDLLGLAVDVENPRASRLYEHLGYVEWQHGHVIDSWEEPAVDGRHAVEHRETCRYLTKRVS